MTTGAAPEVVQAGEPRLARLESLRALAALGVLLGHCFLFARVAERAPVDATFPQRLLIGGGLGVWLFFALTGYLLYRPWARRDFGAGGAIDLRAYARNRAFRILPLYWAVLVVLLVIQEGGGSAAQWARFAVFAQNFSSGTVETVDGPMWSLVVEVEFYLALPVLAWGLARVARGRARTAALVLAATGTAAMAWHWVAVEGADAVDRRWAYSLPVTFGFFAAGMLVALATETWATRPPRALAGALGRGELWLLAAAALWVLVADDLRLLALAAPASALTIGACVLAPRPGRVVRALDARPLAAIGIVSYSLYLLHWPLLDALDGDVRGLAALTAVVVPASLVLAATAYHLVEAPFLRLRRRWA